MAHTHDVYDMESHFEINGSSRFIKETSDTKLVLVQGDHKSEVLTFKMPRYVDGHDMLECNKVRVHYINIETGTNNKSADVYEVTDMALCDGCEDVITFTWTVEAPATKYYGPLSFLVKFECTEGSNVLYQWNTAKYVGVNVLAGIDNSEEFVDKYSNVLDEWYNKLTNGADTIEEMTEQLKAEIEAEKENAKKEIVNKAQEALTPTRTVEITPNTWADGTAVCSKVTIKSNYYYDAVIRIEGLRGYFSNFALFTIPDELLPDDAIGASRDPLEIYQIENVVYLNGEYTSGVDIVINYTLRDVGIPELVDMRTGYDGKVYPTAGDAIREQVKKAMQTGGGSVTDEQIENAVRAYLDENGVPSVSPVRIGNVSLPANGWTGAESPYSQVVNINGANRNSLIDLRLTAQQLDAFDEKDVAFMAENADGVITVYAIGQKPQNDYVFQVKITEVVYE